MKVLITGGCGFIGSEVVRVAIEQGHEVVNLDKLTYAGNPANVADVADNPRYSFIHGDIADPQIATQSVQGVEVVINLAAESHVDRSLHNPTEFIETDVVGTATLIMAAREAGVRRFVQVSTDEVYGSIPAGAFKETDPIQPSSPYSASKAGGEVIDLVIGGQDIVITRGSNTYGPRQYPEKLVPLFITNALDGLPLPVYGDGQQIRDWIHVRDHAEGIWHAMEHGEAGQVYNVGGGNEWPNLEITERILAHTGASDDLITYVEDRPGHDRRYALDTTKLRGMGWAPKVDFDEGLASTVEWYRERRDWWEPIKSGEYADWYAKNYATR